MWQEQSKGQAHPPDDVLRSENGKVKTLFLPKNRTALIKPIDQGIIEAFKTHYGREQFTLIVNSDEEMEMFLKSVNLKTVSYSEGLEWESVGTTTISNCWNICSVEENVTDEHCSDTDFNSSVHDLNRWVVVANKEPISEVIYDKDIVDAVRKKSSEAVYDEDD
ncbi:tigger transposable element-derived protein 7-like [Schistocerca gregaria]|uniref:tigger transposable element-derived protein 7-like n=1 Tax=Schistocerca gregaria TaxID=7010 RepID=UPI00211E6B94|nr:tigger transposable element-derived protein 7-like [Schistocerca gregaria]